MSPERRRKSAASPRRVKPSWCSVPTASREFSRAPRPSIASGPAGRVIGIAPSASTPSAHLLAEHGFVDVFLEADACDALAVVELTKTLLPDGADLTINCVNVPGTELASILVTRDGGTVYFFSMSTSFTAAALGAEGVGKDVTMIIGNGYATGHAEIALQTLRDYPPIQRYFLERFGQSAR